MGTYRKIYIMCPHRYFMVYHEIRIINGKEQNYLVYNKRKNGKWLKKSKFIGYRKIPKEKISELKREFEIELIAEKKYSYLKKEQVIEIEKLREAYFLKIKTLKKEEFLEFEKSFFTELTYNSNAIEGNSLSLEQTNLILNEGIVPEGKSLREIYEAKNHREAINFIKNYKKDLDELFILKLHSIILKDISQNFAGRYRENPVRIFGSDVRFPDSYLVPQLVKNLVYWHNKNKKKMHPFELAAIFSMKLVTIHPFVDGNGRISRLMMNFILNKNKYPWINIYNEQRAEYLKATRKANQEDYSLIIEFLIKNLRENLRDFNMIS